MHQTELAIIILFTALIPGYSLAGAVTSRGVCVEHQSVSIDETSTVDELISTKSLGDLTVNIHVSAKVFRHKIESFPVEICEEIMSEQWNSSSLAALPVEFLPLLKGVRNVSVDCVTSIAAVFNALYKLKTIDLTFLNWNKINKQDTKLLLQMLSKIIDRQRKLPKVIGNLNKFYITAIERLQYDIIRVLFSTPVLLEHIDPSVGNNYAIRFASARGDIEVVKLLLKDSRVDPSAGYNFAICFASKNGHVEVVKLLLTDTRVDPTADNNYAIRKASENGYDEVVKLLLNDGRCNPTPNRAIMLK